MDNELLQLQQNVVALFKEIAPQTTTTGFPSQYTTQTFNNNLIEQSVALNHATKNIDHYLLEIEQHVNNIKINTISYTNDYLFGTQTQNDTNSHNITPIVSTTEDEQEMRLLCDILLLTKEHQAGTQLIHQQHQRLTLIDSMLQQVNQENLKVSQAILE